MKNLLVSFLKKEAGNIAIGTAVMLPVMVGAAGFGVETGYWYHKDLVLQQAADKASYAGAIEKRSGSTSTVMNAAGLSAANQNGYQPGSFVLLNPPTSGAYSGNVKAVEVQLTTPVQRYFSKVFTNTPITAGARAVTLIETAETACVLALDPTSSSTIYLNGNAGLSLTGCTVMANSTAADAVLVQGSSELTTDCIISGGGVGTGQGDITLTSCATPITNAPAAADPFASIPFPATPAGANKTTTGNPLNPGKYAGMSINSAKTLNPGQYHIISGTLRFNANANITGNGVTFFMYPGTTISINGSALMNLAAPTTGTYAGILFFASQTMTGAVTFNGNSSSHLTGALYFPKAEVTYSGNFTGLGGCTQVVASAVHWTGSSSITQDCTTYGMVKIPAFELIRLVE